MAAEILKRRTALAILRPGGDDLWIAVLPVYLRTRFKSQFHIAWVIVTLFPLELSRTNKLKREIFRTRRIGTPRGRAARRALSARIFTVYAITLPNALCSSLFRRLYETGSSNRNGIFVWNRERDTACRGFSHLTLRRKFDAPPA